MLASAYTAMIIGFSEGPPEWNLWKFPEMRILSWRTEELMSQNLRDHNPHEPMKAFLKTPTPSCTFDIGSAGSWLLMSSYHLLLSRNFSGSGYLAVSTRVSLLRITVILKCMIFSLVWVSFQVPFTFYSSGIFNSFLSCCLSCKVSFTSTSCLLNQCLSFQSTPHPFSSPMLWYFSPSSTIFPRFHCKSYPFLPSSFPVSKR